MIDEIRKKIQQAFCRHTYRFEHVAHNGFTVYHIYKCNSCKKTKIHKIGK